MALLRVPPCIRYLHHHCLHQALPAAPCSTLHRVLPAPSIACSGVLSSEPCPPFHAMPCFALLLPFAPCIWVLSPPVLQGAGILGCRGILAQAWAARKTPSLHLDLQIKNHDLEVLGVKSFNFFLKSWYLSENTGYQPSCALCWHWWPGWVLLKHC